MDLKRKIHNYKSADLNCYDLKEYCLKTVVNEFGINTSKSILKEKNNKIYEYPKKFFNQRYILDEK